LIFVIEVTAYCGIFEIYTCSDALEFCQYPTLACLCRHFTRFLTTVQVCVCVCVRAEGVLCESGEIQYPIFWPWTSFQS